ncbi:MAG: hypothetical protein J6X59_02540 [Bacteroidales bacterium]|nr:hypothetical protein [Bacteroidales bacterium]
MKKVFFTAFAALAFAFTMTACGGENPTDSSNADTTNQPAVTDTTHKCCKGEGKECDHQCDTTQCKHQCKEGQEGCKHQCKEGEKKECCDKANK